jgi:two-component system chemotaxis response regulator CheY
MADILIVDDSRTSRKILRDVLEFAGHTVVGEAKNGEECIDLYERLQPDVVTMDITMPVLDGLGALKLLMGVHPQAKVVMITAAGQQKNVLEALKTGAADCIAKPFERQHVIDVIGRVTGSKLL